ncbi:MAG: hypothetical protein ACT4OX_15250 [Actinomycetota bacterium]
MGTRRTGATRLMLATFALAAGAPAAPASGAPTPAPNAALEGTLVVAHGDDFAHQTRMVAHDFILIRPGRAPLRLETGGRDVTRLAGKRVRVRGHANGSALVATSVTAAPAAVTATAVTGTKRVAVLMVNFRDDDSTPYTTSDVRNVLFGATGSVDAFYRSSSDGKVSISGDVFGWYELPSRSISCQYITWEQDAREKATRAGVNLAGYDHVIVEFPRTPSCRWDGLGYIGGVTSFINGAPDMYTAAHELGHNFGAEHASAARCTSPAGGPVTLSASCQRDEYGDPYSVMGHGLRTHTAVHAARYGWIPAQSITADGQYHLAPLHAGAHPQLLRVARPFSTSTLDLDLRANYAPFDAFSATDTATKGVSIRLNERSSPKPQLLDMTPATSSMTDGALLAGQTFVDPITGLRITTDRIDATGATVTITFPKPDPTPPSAPPNLRVVATHSTTVELAWDNATDNDLVLDYDVARDSVVVARTALPRFTDTGLSPGTTHTWAVRARDRSTNLGPAATVVATTTPLDTTPPSKPTGLNVQFAPQFTMVSWSASVDNDEVGQYIVTRGQTSSYIVASPFYDAAMPPGASATWSIQAVDRSGLRSEVATVTATNGQPTGGPTTPAGVKISLARRNVKLSWNASTGGTGEIRYDVQRNGKSVRTARRSNITDKPGRGTWTYVVVAFDAQGNRSGPSAAVTVTVT